MLDADLSRLYAVTTSALLQAVRRNAARFPEDFCFQLAIHEWEVLRSQSVISKEGAGGRRYLPFVFTEQGVAMLSSVLRSDSAIAVNIEIMRTFVRLREALSSNKQLAKQFALLESRIDNKLRDQDRAIADILDVIRKLMEVPVKPKRRIGFL
jgi:hypothetical protein